MSNRGACDCPAEHYRGDGEGRCTNPPASSEGGLDTCSLCGCCLADCPDVHAEPSPARIVPGSMRVAAEHVATLDPQEQQRLREQEARGELRIVSRAEMRRIIGAHDDANDLDFEPEGHR